MEFDLDKLSKLGDNRKIIYIDNHFKIVLRTVIQKILRTHSGVPVEWEDIYYEFLYSTPGIVKEYSGEQTVTFKTFLGVRCRYFTYNTCKKYLSKNHQVMNKYIHMDKQKLENYSDGIDITNQIDTSQLSKMEKVIFNDYFIECKSLLCIQKLRGISRYKIRQLAESIRGKLLVQIKN